MKDNTIIDEAEVNTLINWANHVQEVEGFINNEGNEYFFKEGVQLDFDTIYQRQYEKFKQVPGLSENRFKESEIDYLQTWITRIDEVSSSPLKADSSIPFFLQNKPVYNFQTSMVYLLSKNFIKYLISRIESKKEIKSNFVLEEPDNVITGIRKKKQYETNIPDKWFGLLHYVLEQTGIEKKNQFNPESRTEAVDYGREHYGTALDFYNEYRKVYFAKEFIVYINSMTDSDRRKWKHTIKELSGNNSKVILWLKHKPE